MNVSYGKLSQKTLARSIGEAVLASHITSTLTKHCGRPVPSGRFPVSGQLLFSGFSRDDGLMGKIFRAD